MNLESLCFQRVGCGKNRSGAVDEEMMAEILRTLLARPPAPTAAARGVSEFLCCLAAHSRSLCAFLEFANI